MRAIPLPPVAPGIVLFCAYGCRDLVDAWRDSPFDSLGWIALSVWGLPLLILWWEEGGGREGGRASPALLGGGLGMGLIGALGSLNVLQHAGLALSLAGLLPGRRGHALWLATAASWMPVFGWALGRHCAVEVVPLARMGVAAAGVLWMGFRVVDETAWMEFRVMDKTAKNGRGDRQRKLPEGGAVGGVPVTDKAVHSGNG